MILGDVDLQQKRATASQVLVLDQWKRRVDAGEGLGEFDRLLMRHPFGLFSRSSAKAGCKLIVNARKILEKDNGVAMTAGAIVAKQIKKQKNGREMAWLTIHDGTAALRVTCFADYWAYLKPRLRGIKQPVLLARLRHLPPYGESKSLSCTLAGPKGSPEPEKAAVYGSKNVLSDTDLIRYCEERQQRRSDRKRIFVFAPPFVGGR